MQTNCHVEQQLTVQKLSLSNTILEVPSSFHIYFLKEKSHFHGNLSNSYGKHVLETVKNFLTHFFRGGAVPSCKDEGPSARLAHEPRKERQSRECEGVCELKLREEMDAWIKQPLQECQYPRKAVLRLWEHLWKISAFPIVFVCSAGKPRKLLWTFELY